MPTDLDAERFALTAWATSEAGARAMWQAWFDSMAAQHLEVDRHHQRWVILEPVEQRFHGLMAQAFMTSALAALAEEVASGG